MSDYWSQDIVERLKQRAEAAKAEGTGTAVSDATHFAQAAEEIFRLRNTIQWCLDRDERNGSLPGSYADRLRASLTKEKQS